MNIKVVQFVTFRIEHFVEVDTNDENVAIVEAEGKANEVEVTCQITEAEEVKSYIDYEYWDDEMTTERVDTPVEEEIPFDADEPMIPHSAP